MSASALLLLIGYYGALLALAFYGSHRLRLIRTHYRVRCADPPEPPFPPEMLGGAVLVQLPVYNERFVVDRLLTACARLRSPLGPLRLQLLDDSGDETSAVAAAVIARLSAEGVDVVQVRRGSREGFKAGALAEGLRLDALRPDGPAPFVAVFDADFVPEPDFLERTLPHLADPRAALVQARWGHLNRDDSLLTRLQAIFLDGHFVMESCVRFRAGLFFNFNGTAGVFRRAAIEDAGGWSGETLTEDLDLSYRALLRGWRFVFLRDVTAPAELPARMADFKSQQARWTKGSIEVGRKLLPRVLRAPLPGRMKLEAFTHLTNNLSYPLLVLLALLLVPSLEVRQRLGWLRLLWLDAPLFLISSLSVGLFYLVSQRELGRGSWRDLRLVPGMMSLGIGMALSNAVGVIEALAGSGTAFHRTPKLGATVAAGRVYRTRVRPLALAEVALALHIAVALAAAAITGSWASVPFLLVFFGGFCWGAFHSVRDALAA